MRGVPKWSRRVANERRGTGLVLLAGLALLVLVGYVASAPPRSASFPPNALPPGASGLFAVEHADGFDFRWTKPSATIPVPIARPGAYTLLLGLLDSAPQAADRAVWVRVNGRDLGAVYPTASQRYFRFNFTLPVEDWRPGWSGTALVELRTAPYVAPGDPRMLGTVLTGVAVHPSGPAWPLVMRLTLVYAALLATYVVLARLARIPNLVSAAMLAAATAAVAGATLVNRDATLFWLAQPAIEPLWAFGAALLLVPALVLVKISHVASSRQLPPAQTPASEAVADRANERLMLAAVAGLTLFALASRLWRLDQLSLWLDEGFTVMYSRLSWPELFGLRGQYDVHPPLYYAVVKLASMALPSEIAGRAVSAVCGALVVPVTYRLSRPLLSRAGALVAALTLTIAPVHVWYSREARMYSLALLAIGLSYLALLELRRGSGHSWLAVYAVATLAALYTDFSALFALAPQTVLLARLWMVQRAVAARAVALFLLAVAAFVPWLFAAAQRVGGIANQQAYFLGVTWQRIATTLLGIAGVSGGSVDYWGDIATPWTRWPVLRPLLVLVVVLVAVAGLRWLWSRGEPLLMSAVLLSGTLGAAILASLVAPSFTYRTVIYALLGWVLVVGAAISTRHGAAWRAVAAAGTVTLLIANAGGMVAIYTGATKEDFRGIARATATVATTGQPILTDGPLMDAFVDVYAPGVRGGRFFTLNGDALPPGFERSASQSGQFWFVYGDFPWMKAREVRQRFVAMGYCPASRQFFPDALFLDHYVRCGTAPPHRTTVGQVPSRSGRPICSLCGAMSSGTRRDL